VGALETATEGQPGRQGWAEVLTASLPKTVNRDARDITLPRRN
jgi:hypothetical protein